MSRWHAAVALLWVLGVLACSALRHWPHAEFYQGMVVMVLMQAAGYRCYLDCREAVLDAYRRIKEITS